jgi:hypothetical protein
MLQQAKAPAACCCLGHSKDTSGWDSGADHSRLLLFEVGSSRVAGRTGSRARVCTATTRHTLHSNNQAHTALYRRPPALQACFRAEENRNECNTPTTPGQPHHWAQQHARGTHAWTCLQLAVRSCTVQPSVATTLISSSTPKTTACMHACVHTTPGTLYWAAAPRGTTGSESHPGSLFGASSRTADTTHTRCFVVPKLAAAVVPRPVLDSAPRNQEPGGCPRVCPSNHLS